MPNVLTHEQMKEIYGLAVNAQRSRNFVYSVRLFELLIDANDPFYTPFSLAGLAQSYSALDQHDLEMATFKKVTQLPSQEQLLFNPSWLAVCYQKLGNLKEAAKIHSEILKLSPKDTASIGALAEISVLDGKLEQAEAFAVQLQQQAEPKFVILGRVVRAFAFTLQKRSDEALQELSWVGQFMISGGNVPVGTWDYRDLQPLVLKTGPNARVFQLLIDVLNGKIALPEFTAAWSEMTAALQLNT